MASFLYPTEDCYDQAGLTWLDRMKEQFKASARPTFTFAFLRFQPQTVPRGEHEPYWMYFFFSQERSARNLHDQVPYRVRVIATSLDPLHDNEDELPDVHRGGADRRIYFEADLIEEIRQLSGTPFTSRLFDHEDGETQVLQAARNSIPPVRRTQPMLVVQQTRWELVD